MGDDFNPLNPIVWLSFFGFVALTLAVWAVFRRNHPDYGAPPDARGRTPEKRSEP